MHISVVISVQGFDEDGPSLVVKHKEVHNIDLYQRTGDVADLLVDAVRNQIGSFREEHNEREETKKEEAKKRRAKN